MATTFLNTKMYWGRLPPNLVARPRLLEKLDASLAAGQSLTLISAPAGYGKTTLLHEWLSTKDEDRRQKDEAKSSERLQPHPSSLIPHPFRVAWLTLDQADDDPTRFWSYVILSLQSIDDELGETELAQLRSAQSPSVKEILPSLINEIDSLHCSAILVLDDFHVITLPAVYDTLTYLLESLPPNFHLVLSSRSDPLIPVAKLRTRGQVVEIRADDLRFRPDEAAALLDRSTGIALSAEQVATLDERTEGWVAGLQMAALSMTGGSAERVDGFLRGFAGTHRYIMDYLLEEVLGREPQEVQSFLLHTAILARLSGPLCDAVTSTSGGQEMLETLEKRNLFVVPLDDHRTWYRYHHLFADLLRAQLQRSLRAQGIAALHIRAAEWHGHHGSVEEAIHHASMASDDERVERFIEQHYSEILSRGEQAAMRYWSSKLSRELVYRRPWLCIYEAHSRAWFGELDEADRLLDEAEKCIRSEALAQDARAMQGHWAYVKSRVAAMRGDLPRAIEFCLTARECVPASNRSLQFNTRVTLGYEYFLEGDYANATQVLDEAIRSGITAGALIYTVAAACVKARLVAVQGQLHESYDTYQMAARLISEASGEHRDATAVVEVGLADVLCEWNDLDAALVHLQRGLALLPLWGKADDFALAYITQARIRLAQAHTSDAIADIEKAVHLIQSSAVFSEARHAVEMAQVRLWLSQGDLQAASRWSASQEERLGSDGRFGFQNELAYIAQARVFMAQNKPKQAIGLLSRLEETTQTAGRMGRVIEILVLKALAMQEMGNSGNALQALTTCLTLAEPEGYVRVLLDEGRPMESLLAQWLAHSGTGPLRDYGRHLLSQFNSEPHRAKAAPEKTPLAGGLTEPLSQRELEVLQLMSLGRTNQEIARQLIVARGTIKAHAVSIFRKLDVANRTEAVTRARQLGILS